jgi:hypothetical protein
MRMRSKSFILSAMPGDDARRAGREEEAGKPAMPDATATRAGGGSHSGDMTAGRQAQRWRDTRLAA